LGGPKTFGKWIKGESGDPGGENHRCYQYGKERKIVASTEGRDRSSSGVDTESRIKWSAMKIKERPSRQGFVHVKDRVGPLLQSAQQETKKGGKEPQGQGFFTRNGVNPQTDLAQLNKEKKLNSELKKTENEEEKFGDSGVK